VQRTSDILSTHVNRLQAFADDTKIPHLRNAFNGIRDVVQMLLNPNIMKYIDSPDLRSQEYPSLDFTKVAKILQKVSEMIISRYKS
jgi:hypothetical protein